MDISLTLRQVKRQVRRSILHLRHVTFASKAHARMWKAEQQARWQAFARPVLESFVLYRGYVAEGPWTEVEFE